MHGPDGPLLAVLPATHHVDTYELARHLGGSVRLATEGEVAHHFRDCEWGVVPPFGNLYGLPVWADATLTRDREIWFNAGTHDQTVHMAYADFARLVQPTVATFGRRAEQAA